MEAGLSSGEECEDEETVPEGFEEEVKESRGRVDMESVISIPPISGLGVCL